MKVFPLSEMAVRGAPYLASHALMNALQQFSARSATADRRSPAYVGVATPEAVAQYHDKLHIRMHTVAAAVADGRPRFDPTAGKVTTRPANHVHVQPDLDRKADLKATSHRRNCHANAHPQ